MILSIAYICNENGTQKWGYLPPAFLEWQLIDCLDYMIFLQYQK